VNAELFDTMTAMMFAGSSAILGVLAVRSLVRRWFGAQIAYATWVAVPLVALAMLLPAPVRSISTMLRPANSMATHAATVALMPVSIDWRPAIALIWLAGVVVAGTVFVLQQRRYLRSLGRLHALDDRLARADSVDGGPALVGAWRPRIVLPADFDTRYAPRERELVLAHEQTHLVRGDALINALVIALRCLNWFNPLVHYAAAKFRFDQELACDAAVITRFPEARRSYADAMLKTQLAGQSRQELRLPVGCRWPSGHPLKERILMLKRPLPTHARRVLGISVIAGIALCGSFVSWAAQPERIEPAAAAVNRPASEFVAASYRRMSAPTYPASAVSNHVEGIVYVAVEIDAAGGVSSATVDHVEPPIAAVLGAAATGSVKTWRFNAPTRDGEAIGGHAIVPVRFAISDPATIHPSALPPQALDIIDVVARPASRANG
jgi:TonB family protein